MSSTSRAEQAIQEMAIQEMVDRETRAWNTRDVGLPQYPEI